MSNDKDISMSIISNLASAIERFDVDKYVSFFTIPCKLKYCEVIHDFLTYDAFSRTVVGVFATYKSMQMKRAQYYILSSDEKSIHVRWMLYHEDDSLITNFESRYTLHNSKITMNETHIDESKETQVKDILRYVPMGLYTRICIPVNDIDIIKRLFRKHFLPDDVLYTFAANSSFVQNKSIINLFIETNAKTQCDAENMRAAFIKALDAEALSTEVSITLHMLKALREAIRVV